jgi:glutamine synthetase
MQMTTISKSIRENNIKWIQIHFTDLLGGLRTIHMPAERFLNDHILRQGSGFDGSSVGLKHVENSDMIAIPDPETFHILSNEHDEARIIADIFETSYQPSAVDSRLALKKAVIATNEQGFDDVIIAPEMEFFVLSPNQETLYEPLTNRAYFVPPPIDEMKQFRKTLSEHLLKSGFNVKYHHHESGRYQHEIEIKSLAAINAADFCMFFKYLSRNIAALDQLQVSFIPKLFPDEAGNGMHVHIKLMKQGINAFYNAQDPYFLSDTARYFIGGVLHHAKSIAAFAIPTMNSYKRLIPHYEAPLYIAWGRHNRSSLVRIAAKQNTDVEVRNGDPSANPYLYFAALIYAGLDGISRKLQTEPVEQNIYNMSANELNTLGIHRLPTTLLESLQELEQNKYLRTQLGEELVETYIENKREELNSYLSEVSDVDIKYYLHC